MKINVLNAKYAAVSTSASTLSSLLEPLPSQPAKDSYAQLVSLQSRLQEDRRLAELAVELAASARATHKALTRSLDRAIDSAIAAGELFGWPDIADFKHQEQAVHLTLEGLEKRFALRGDLGLAFTRRLDELGDVFRRATADLAQAEQDAQRTSREYASTFYRLSSAINLARSVLQLEAVPLPAPTPRPKKKVKKPAAAAPVATLVPAPTPPVLPQVA